MKKQIKKIIRKFNPMKFIVIVSIIAVCGNILSLKDNIVGIQNPPRTEARSVVRPTYTFHEDTVGDSTSTPDAIEVSYDVKRSLTPMIEHEGIELQASPKEEEEKHKSNSTKEKQDDSNMIKIGSIEIQSSHGGFIETDVVKLDAERMMKIYHKKIESPNWDEKNKIVTLTVLWDFLVEQQGIPASNAAGILGSIYAEGNFAQQQGTYDYVTNIDSARMLYGAGGCGYGIAQWTYYNRQENLLKYYEKVYELFPDDWDSVKVIAECSFLLEELKAYKIFDNIYKATSIEDAAGRVASKYEQYSNYENDWYSSNGVYHLASSNSNGAYRLKFANHIYNHFTK